jgi:hypothetical protein
VNAWGERLEKCTGSNAMWTAEGVTSPTGSRLRKKIIFDVSEIGVSYCMGVFYEILRETRGARTKSWGKKDGVC